MQIMIDRNKNAAEASSAPGISLEASTGGGHVIGYVLAALSGWVMGAICVFMI